MYVNTYVDVYTSIYRFEFFEGIESPRHVLARASVRATGAYSKDVVSFCLKSICSAQSINFSGGLTRWLYENISIICASGTVSNPRHYIYGAQSVLVS